MYTADYLRPLAAYVSVLERAAGETNQADDRPKYQQHLAAAAQMYTAIIHHCSVPRLKELVSQERRSFGWGFLAGDMGTEVETAFDGFAKVVESEEKT